MSKQEEIREGFARTLGKYSNSADQVYQLLKYLHSQGVVIKVERKEPISCGHAAMTAARYSQTVTCPLIVAGYVAVEPLIKEVPNG